MPGPARVDEEGRRYHLLALAGRGAYGDVYLAELESGGFRRRVALKVLNETASRLASARRRIQREARILGRLEHRNVVAALDLVRVDDRWALVMDWVGGADLERVRATLSATGQSIPGRALFEIGAGVASALHAAHCARDEDGRLLGVVHRDIKPSNLRLTPDGDVKVVDFGVAMAGTPASTPGAVGTTLYMAPERLAKVADTPAGDVYGLGATLIELLQLRPLGRSPVEPAAHAALVEEAIGRVRPLLRGPADELEATIATLRATLACDPGERPTAEALVERFERHAEALGGESLRAFCRRFLPRVEAVLGPPQPIGVEPLENAPTPAPVSEPLANSRTLVPDGDDLADPSLGPTPLVVRSPPPPEPEPARGPGDPQQRRVARVLLAVLPFAGALAASTTVLAAGALWFGSKVEVPAIVTLVPAPPSLAGAVPPPADLDPAAQQGAGLTDPSAAGLGDPISAAGDGVGAREDGSLAGGAEQLADGADPLAAGWRSPGDPDPAGPGFGGAGSATLADAAAALGLARSGAAPAAGGARPDRVGAASPAGAAGAGGTSAAGSGSVSPAGAGHLGAAPAAGSRGAPAGFAGPGASSAQGDGLARSSSMAGASGGAVADGPDPSGWDAAPARRETAGVSGAGGASGSPTRRDPSSATTDGAAGPAEAGGLAPAEIGSLAPAGGSLAAPGAGSLAAPAAGSLATSAGGSLAASAPGSLPASAGGSVAAPAHPAATAHGSGAAADASSSGAVPARPSATGTDAGPAEGSSAGTAGARPNPSGGDAAALPSAGAGASGSTSAPDPSAAPGDGSSPPDDSQSRRAPRQPEARPPAPVGSRELVERARFAVPGGSALEVRCGLAVASGTSSVRLTRIPPGPCRVEATHQGARYVTELRVDQAGSFTCAPVSPSGLSCRPDAD